jgi:hypothetical protein
MSFCLEKRPRTLAFDECTRFEKPTIKWPAYLDSAAPSTEPIPIAISREKLNAENGHNQKGNDGQQQSVHRSPSRLCL